MHVDISAISWAKVAGPGIWLRPLWLETSNHPLFASVVASAVAAVNEHSDDGPVLLAANQWEGPSRVGACMEEFGLPRHLAHVRSGRMALVADRLAVYTIRCGEHDLHT